MKKDSLLDPLSILKTPQYLMRNDELFLDDYIWSFSFVLGKLFSFLKKNNEKIISMMKNIGGSNNNH